VGAGELEGRTQCDWHGLCNRDRMKGAIVRREAILALPVCVIHLIACAPDVCRDAEKRLGYRACVESVSSVQTWQSIAALLTQVDQVRTTRYMVPARNGARLPTLFEDDWLAAETGTFHTHLEFLKVSFPKLFPGLTLGELDTLTVDPQKREFYAGTVTEFVLTSGAHTYGYLIWDSQDAAGSITCAQAQQVHTALASRFSPAPLVMIPTTSFQTSMLATCQVASYDPSQDVPYEVYNKGVGFGTLHVYTLSAFQQAEANGEFGWQDIVAIDEAPMDIETVVSGVITGTRQGALSHVNVRMAARGTPNCYQRDALNQLGSWNGQLVRMECSDTALTIRAATLAEATAWWAQIRPTPIVLRTPDWAYTDMPNVLDVPTATVSDRELARQRFGGKAYGLEVMYQRVSPELQQPAFAIPFAPYGAFVKANGIDAILATDLADPNFQTQRSVRMQRLLDLQGAMLAAPCDPALIQSIGARIMAVFGRADVMLHFRSSSNAEDAPGFGANGIYNSTDGCWADDIDPTPGPSACDSTLNHKVGICLALETEWSQLWNARAYDERDWYGIDQTTAAMAIVVNPRTPHDVACPNGKCILANIVGFSGDTTAPEGSPQRNNYVIDAQVPPYDAVSNLPGVYPENDLLSFSNGQVTTIVRNRSSSVVTAGQLILDDAHLDSLGAAYWSIVQSFPIDDPVPAGKRVLLLWETKQRLDGTFLMYEVRPFYDNL
jgi:hypothetical protein